MRGEPSNDTRYKTFPFENDIRDDLVRSPHDNSAVYDKLMDQLSGSQIVFYTDDSPEFQMKVQKKEHLRTEGELRKGYHVPLLFHFDYRDEGLPEIMLPVALDVPPEMIQPAFFEEPNIEYVSHYVPIIEEEESDDILEAYPHLKVLF